MAEEKKFKWLTTTCYLGDGRPLSKGQVYAVSEFREDVVAYWIAQGAAALVIEKKPEADLPAKA